MRHYSDLSALAGPRLLTAGLILTCTVAVGLVSHRESVSAPPPLRMSSRNTLPIDDMPGMDRDFHIPTPFPTLVIHAGQNQAVVFAADGSSLVAEANHRIVIWDVRTGKLKNTLAAPRQLGGISPDGRMLATLGSEFVEIWDTSTWKKIRTLRPVHTTDTFGILVWQAAFSPDGKTLATSGRDVGVDLWDAKSGTHLATLQDSSDPALGEQVDAIGFSGGDLVTSSRMGTGFVVWDLKSRKVIERVTGADEHPVSCAVAAGRGLVAIGSWAGVIRIWSIRDRRWVRTIDTFSSPPVCLRFSPDGFMLASVDGRGAARAWDLQTGRAIFTTTAFHDILVGIAVAPDGQTLATAGSMGIKLWKLSSPRVLVEANHRPLALRPGHSR